MESENGREIGDYSEQVVDIVPLTAAKHCGIDENIHSIETNISTLIANLQTGNCVEANLSKINKQFSTPLNGELQIVNEDQEFIFEIGLEFGILKELFQIIQHHNSKEESPQRVLLECYTILTHLSSGNNTRDKIQESEVMSSAVQVIQNSENLDLVLQCIRFITNMIYVDSDLVILMIKVFDRINGIFKLATDSQKSSIMQLYTAMIRLNSENNEQSKEVTLKVHKQMVQQILALDFNSEDLNLLFLQDFLLAVMTDRNHVNDILTYIDDMGYFPKIVSLLHHEDASVVDGYLCVIKTMLLGNCLSSINLLHSNLLHVLAGLLYNRSHSIVQHTLSIISTMAAHSDIVPQLFDTGMLPAIVYYLGHSDMKLFREPLYIFESIIKIKPEQLLEAGLAINVQIGENLTRIIETCITNTDSKMNCPLTHALHIILMMVYYLKSPLCYIDEAVKESLVSVYSSKTLKEYVSNLNEQDRTTELCFDMEKVMELFHGVQIQSDINEYYK